MSEEVQPGRTEDPDDFELIDLEALRDHAGFVYRSVWRRRRLALGTFLGVLAATGLLLAVLPRTYQVQMQLLAQKNSLMPALGNPNRTVPSDADAPTRAAPEAVKRRDNLVSLLKQTDLMNRWEATRPRLLKLKDWIVDLLGPNETEEERINTMVDYLEKQLWVLTTEDTISIGIDWPDAEQAYRLVDGAQQNFLEQRHLLEVSAIAETITILEGHAQALKETIDVALEDLARAEASRAKGRGILALPIPARRDSAFEAQRSQAAEVKVMLDSKRQAIRELEDFRRRRLAELQVELAQQRAVYADAHPAVVKVLQSIAALQRDSPQLSALRQDERQLLSDYEKVARVKGDAPVPAPAPGTSTAERPGRRGPGAPEETNAELARTRLRFAMSKYDSLLERIDSAKIELDTARAAFKYRYSVLRPAMFPKHPTKPRIPLIALAGLLLAVLSAFATTGLADWRSRRVLEPWQVGRQLGLTILGALPAPPPPPRPVTTLIAPMPPVEVPAGPVQPATAGAAPATAEATPAAEAAPEGAHPESPAPSTEVAAKPGSPETPPAEVPAVTPEAAAAAEATEPARAVSHG